jgi:hypothetical protein
MIKTVKVRKNYKTNIYTLASGRTIAVKTLSQMTFASR